MKKLQTFKKRVSSVELVEACTFPLCGVCGNELEGGEEEDSKNVREMRERNGEKRARRASCRGAEPQRKQKVPPAN